MSICEISTGNSLAKPLVTFIIRFMLYQNEENVSGNFYSNLQEHLAFLSCLMKIVMIIFDTFKC